MNETSFRIALVVVIVLTMVVTVYHRLQAAKSGEKISHKDEGYLSATVLRLAGLVLWISTFGYLFFPTYFQWAAMPLPAWLRWTGVVTGALCSLLMYWTLSSLGKNLTDTVVTRSEATLVTSGPYRWVRHPFYVTAALLMASVTLLTANWFIGISSVAVLALLAVRTPKEEQMLIERFGRQYRDYMATTGRFIPRIGR
ncbi:Isoprenylcysteine carboxyl methyltransferase (ICMT) family protein [Anatilimnocola aggregata]|uniref:Isoprenylcysteine carboxyl methyltransferase (ICMT) family protein n=1 Tax=Anatilimnocola aggregata TaxID=2528021 RepID=A0A517Y6K5_9BACT|nr:isoprenylcysteine carboxylmethyltransferase family protein [Anatilimnocola aggregata]QDU25868.1 Isoprenylcysteine carboxyl methyltransferase (ICMT) family protein [Anatilimnocola aggregata]